EAAVIPVQSAVGEIIELGISIQQMKFEDKKIVGFQVTVRKDGKELERWPSMDLVRFEIPTERSDQIFWQI
ncbi:MAG TPA: hypothetical protein VGB16_00585, partial [candidate division Zixibacteria bacterium]